jgi:AcrR family transcriptional regulator
VFGNRNEKNKPAVFVRFRTTVAELFGLTMKKPEVDKRVRRTHEALRNALLDLMVQRGYEALSVQDILDRAAVGRATFYLHYRNKEDLLRRSLDELRKHLIEGWKSTSGSRGESLEPLGFSLAFFRHVDGHRKLYRAVVGRESGVIVDRQMRRLLVGLVAEDIAASDRKGRNPIRVEMASQYVAGAMMSIVTWWLDHNVKLSAEDINAAFREMALPALKTIHHV